MFQFLNNLDWLDLTFVTVLVSCAALVIAWMMRLGTRLWFTLPWIVALIFVLAGGGWVSAEAQKRESLKVQKAMLSVVPTYALAMQEGGHLKIRRDTASDDPTYLKIIQMQISRLRVNTDVADIYTMRPNENGEFEFVVDSETDYDHSGKIDSEREERTPIGYQYDIENLGVLQEAMAGKTLFDDVPYTDKWGTWVSVTAPIYDDTGKVEAVLGVDYPADKFIAAQHRAKWVVMAFVAVIFAIVLISFVSYARIKLDLARRARTELELRAARDQANAASVAKSAFLANVSHELRTPLTAILGFTELLQDDPSPGLLDEALSTIKRNGDQLLAIVNNVLALTRTESASDAPTAGSIATFEFASDIVNQVRKTLFKPDVTLSLNTGTILPSRFNADADRVRHILVHLLENAIKFTPCGAVELAVRFVEQQSERWLDFEVKDSGIGINASAIDRLFQPFQQADASMSRRFGGTGLGLAVSHRLARSMGHNILVKSDSGRGSVFTLRLRLTDQKINLVSFARSSRPAGLNCHDAASQPLANLSILVVDDQIDNRALLSRMLGKHGASVRIAEDGQIAVDILLAPDAAPVDLVIMDMQMPVLDGYAATSALRKAGFSKPIIALTAHTMPGDCELCLASGCTDYASKPVNTRQFTNMILRYTKDAQPALPLAA